jgi:prepilin-type processing-associated H-X9-DG protein
VRLFVLNTSVLCLLGAIVGTAALAWRADYLFKLHDPWSLSEYHLLALGLFAGGALGFALAARPRRWLPFGAVLFGAVLAPVAFYSSSATRDRREEDLRDMAVVPEYKRGAGETVLGYHCTAPERGGPVLFADGSVRTLSKDEFASAKRAQPAEFVPAFECPVKPAPPEPVPPADLRPGTEVVWRAEQRMRLAGELKALGLAYIRFSGQNKRPPQTPEELRAAVPVSDGTYVVYFGWSVFAGVKPPKPGPTPHQLGVAANFGLMLTGFGASLFFGGLVWALRRAPRVVPEPPPAPNPTQPV